MAIENKIDLTPRPLLARPEEGYKLFPVNKLQYNTNNGVILVTDCKGIPYVGIANKETIDVIEALGAIMNSELFVPHSNDGGQWIHEKFKNALNL